MLPRKHPSLFIFVQEVSVVRLLRDTIYENDLFDEYKVSEEDIMQEEKLVVEESRPEQMELIARYEYYYSHIKYGRKNKTNCAIAILLFVAAICISISVMLSSMSILIKIGSTFIPIMLSFIYGSILDNKYNSNKRLINEASEVLYPRSYQDWGRARYYIDVGANVNNPFGDSYTRVINFDNGRNRIYIPYITWRDYVGVACKVYEIADNHPCNWSIYLKVDVNLQQWLHS